MSVTVDLRLGDCLEIMRDLPDGCVDAVFADPPYGVGKADWDTEFSMQWLEQAASITRRFVIVTPGIPNLLSMPSRVGNLSFVWQTAAWIANGRCRSALGFGNWIGALVYCLDGVSPYLCKQDATRIVIKGTMPEHPCPKPIEFMEWAVETFAPESGTVLDPFMGSGTTGVACVETGRNFIGIEIDPQYFAIAERRIAEAVRNYQPPLALS